VALEETDWALKHYHYFD